MSFLFQKKYVLICEDDRTVKRSIRIDQKDQGRGFNHLFLDCKAIELMGEYETQGPRQV